MAILNILKFPDPRLRSKCQPVQKITPQLIKLADDMLETMKASQGLGLSAIQVNHFVQLLIADTTILFQKGNKNDLAEQDKERYPNQKPGIYEQKIKQPLILFNPHIISRSGHITFKEGCLSFPSYYVEVKRSALIEVKGLDKAGKEVLIKTDGVLSICLQHEIDHLKGKLFIDHLSYFKAERLRAQIKKHGYPSLKESSVPPAEAESAPPPAVS